MRVLLLCRPLGSVWLLGLLHTSRAAGGGAGRTLAPAPSAVTSSFAAEREGLHRASPWR
jgi:hypothetical protein